MYRTIGAFFALGLIAAAVGCQDHYSTQDAYDICNELTERNPATNPDETFLDCVGCYETCGGDCVQSSDATEGYLCPDEIPEEAGAGGGE
ncbi:MAG: hypothetical protein IPM79_15980 [Polyangiaceae bacterium]|jgi:hypothetical protein|nr:hypothetical protein [Polyangiaceae bacterium]MBK8939078.1 hypothetical protein [Polyangiaceae bacterium]